MHRTSQDSLTLATTLSVVSHDLHLLGSWLKHEDHSPVDNGTADMHASTLGHGLICGWRGISQPAYAHAYTKHTSLEALTMLAQREGLETACNSRDHEKECSPSIKLRGVLPRLHIEQGPSVPGVGPCGGLLGHDVPNAQHALNDIVAQILQAIMGHITMGHMVKCGPLSLATKNCAAQLLQVGNVSEIHFQDCCYGG